MQSMRKFQIMTYLKKGAEFTFTYDFGAVAYAVDVTVFGECRPCAMAAIGRPYITGPGPYLELRPKRRGQCVPADHPLLDPFGGYPGLLAAAQAAYHHQI
ncbi:hypothetical protein LCGC14_1240220 [marine sediment metagenome]|uniref:Uncharacterized protein n=1 Tax=marine sediment metagenome TaxID=412755 RepID=A0A0F9LTB3_9ZZZZ